jgi:type IV pilus biogenesis protein CpaD/CtpE
MAWGCATYTNLAAQIAHPRDLVDPAPLGPADAAVAASAVRRYQTDRVYKLPDDTTRNQK